MRVAAIQLEAQVADVEANLAACERLAGEAGEAGAELISLPEFFSTGIGFVPELIERALPPDGAATELLLRTAERHRAFVGGSFLCRDHDGEVRNAFLLATPEGRVAGRHDKDLPTMWENCFYIGGADDGVIETNAAFTVGAAVCWEFMRTRTVRRLRGKVDVVMGGSGWWSIPEHWHPRPLMRHMEENQARTSRVAIEACAGFGGAPVVHAAHSGTLECEIPTLPFRYRGHFEGGASVVDSDGTVLARRERAQGEGIAIAGVAPKRRSPIAEPPDSFWLHRRGALQTFAWNVEGLHGRRWYRRHNPKPTTAA
jgi:predicted amidohydrolase